MADHRKTNIRLWSNVSEVTYDLGLGIEYIAFSGGGAKGMAYLGVLKHLIELDLLKDVKAFSGTSVGAIIAVLACCNPTLDQLQNIMCTLDLDKLISVSNSGWLSTPGRLMNIYSNLGIENGTKIITYLENMLIDLGFDKTCTFNEFYKITGKELKLVAVNLTKQEEYIFDHEHTPDDSIIKGIRASIAIPYIFTPVQVNECSSEILVDGAILNNCPINVFDKPGRINLRAIGFIFTSLKSKNEVRDLQSYTRSLIETMMNQIECNDCSKHFFWDRVVPIDCDGIGDSLKLTDEEGEKLFRIGELCATIFLKQRKDLINENKGFPVNKYL